MYVLIVLVQVPSVLQCKCVSCKYISFKSKSPLIKKIVIAALAQLAGPTLSSVVWWRSQKLLHLKELLCLQVSGPHFLVLHIETQTTLTCQSCFLWLSHYKGQWVVHTYAFINVTSNSQLCKIILFYCTVCHLSLWNILVYSVLHIIHVDHMRNLWIDKIRQLCFSLNMKVKYTTSQDDSYLCVITVKSFSPTYRQHWSNSFRGDNGIVITVC